LYLFLGEAGWASQHTGVLFGRGFSQARRLTRLLLLVVGSLVQDSGVFRRASRQGQGQALGRGDVSTQPRPPEASRQRCPGHAPGFSRALTACAPEPSGSTGPCSGPTWSTAAVGSRCRAVAPILVKCHRVHDTLGPCGFAWPERYYGPLKGFSYVPRWLLQVVNLI
jgi:hypothetical protein